MRSRKWVMASALALGLELAGLLAGCKHAPPKESGGGNGPGASQAQTPMRPVDVYSLHKLIPYTLRVRRPSGPGANPKAGPGGVDYKSNPLPDAHFDCQTSEWLFRELKLTDVRGCLAAPLKQPVRALYKVKWLPVPELELEIAEDTPPCLKTFLPVIPIPREILYQSTEGERLACYSSRLPIESNEIAGFKMPMARMSVVAELPLVRPPLDDDETRAVLLTWAILPFFDRATSTLSAHIVPDSICEKCLGPKTMLKPTDPEPLLWPEI